MPSPTVILPTSAIINDSLDNLSIKQHDTWPPFTAVLSDAVGPINLTHATQVRFLLKGTRRRNPTSTAGVCQILTASQGLVKFNWDAEDTATADLFKAEFEITWDDATIGSVPSDKYLYVNIRADLETTDDGGSGGTGGSPSGGAGGVLSGTYPNPGFAVDMATQTELNAEVATRAAADTALGTRVSTLEGVGGGGSTPTGTAGGVLSGTYPNPGFAVDMATQAELDAVISTITGRQPVDSDLTAIAALSTTAYGRAFLTLADAAAGRTALGLGTAATQPSSAFEVAGAAAAVLAATQPLDSDLTAIAALTTTGYGRAFLALADASAAQTALGLGTAALATLDTDVALAADSDSRLASQKAIRAFVTAKAVPRIVGVLGANLGTAQSITFSGPEEVWLLGTLNSALLTVTLTNRAAGARLKFIGLQDGAGNRTVCVNDGTSSSAPLGLPTTAGAMVNFEVNCPNSLDLSTVIPGGGDVHPFPISYITNLQSSLDGKAALSHTHLQSDITGLASTLNAKADLSGGKVLTSELGTGTADNTKFLRGDQTWATPVGGGSGSPAEFETLYVPRISASPSVIPGRTWRADFADVEMTNAIFDITTTSGTWTYGTADGQPVAIPPTGVFDVGKILTKEMIRNYEVAAEFGVPADVHPSTVVDVVGRYLTDSNGFFTNLNFQSVTPYLTVNAKTKSGGTMTSGQIVSSNSVTYDLSSATIWKLKYKAVEDCHWAKVWISGTPEPDWLAVGREGVGGGVTRELGQSGLRWSNVAGDAFVRQLTVTELISANDNMVFNSDFNITGIGVGTQPGINSGVLGWSIGSALSGNSIQEFVNVTDVSGVSRRFFHARRPTLSDGQLPGMVQDIYRRDQLLGNQIAGFPMRWIDAKALEVGVTSKVVNLRHGAGGTFLGLAVDCYYLDETTSQSNTSSTNYYKVLGPNRLNSSGTPINNGIDGTGTWDWRRDYVRINIAEGTPAPNRVTFAVVIHDNDLLVDDLWMGDFYVRPVA